LRFKKLSAEIILISMLLIFVIKIRSKGHRGGGKEKEKIEELLRETWWKDRE